VGQKGMNQDSDTFRGHANTLTIESIEGELAPDTLIDNAHTLPAAQDILDAATKSDKDISLSGTKRIQFNGQAGTYDLSFDKLSGKSTHHQDCSNAIPLAGAGGAAIAGGVMAAGGIGALIAAPIAAGAMIVSSAIAGCNFAIEGKMELGDIEAKLLTFGIGASTTIGGGKFKCLNHDCCQIKCFSKTSISRICHEC